MINTSYGLSSESLGGRARARSAVRDNLGRFVTDDWKRAGLIDPAVVVRFDQITRSRNGYNSKVDMGTIRQDVKNQ